MSDVCVSVVQQKNEIWSDEVLHALTWSEKTTNRPPSIYSATWSAIIEVVYEQETVVALDEIQALA